MFPDKLARMFQNKTVQHFISVQCASSQPMPPPQPMVNIVNLIPDVLQQSQAIVTPLMMTSQVWWSV